MHFTEQALLQSVWGQSHLLKSRPVLLLAKLADEGSVLFNIPYMFLHDAYHSLRVPR